MVDDRPHLDLIESSIGGGAVALGVCLDLDVGWWPLGGRMARIGPKRSPIHDPGRAERMAAEIAERPGTALAGVMAYEGQIAGVGDSIAGKPLRSAAIRAMQSASERDIHGRLPRVLASVRKTLADHGAPPLRFVNGGGTGSLARTADAGLVDELSAGSGFYAPALFDSYRSLALEPAAFFCLSVVRRPVGGVATLLGGGYSASGAAGADRLPEPYLPGGLRFDRQEGAGEVQTPVTGQAAYSLRVGDRVYLRHAKAGELCEHFGSLYLVEGDRIVDEVADLPRRGARVPLGRGRGEARRAAGRRPVRAPARCSRLRTGPRDRGGRAAPGTRPSADTAGPASRRSGVALAPVRAPVVRAHHILDRREVWRQSTRRSW